MNREEIIHKLYNAKEKIFAFVTHTESLFNRVILLGLLILFLFFFSFNAILSMLISETKIKKNIVEKLESATGKQVEITGDISYKNDPEPVVIINNTQVQNDSKLTDKDYFSAEIIKTKPNLIKAVMGNVDFDNVYFENAVFNIDSSEKPENSVYNLLQNAFSKNSNFYNKKVIFKNLKFNLYKKNPLDAKSPIVRSFTFPELELSPNPAGKQVAYEAKGSFDSNRFRELYFFEINFKDNFGGPSDYNGKFYSTNSEVKFSGKIDTSSEKITFLGKLDGKFSGFAKKLMAGIGFPEGFLDKIRENDDSTISANYLFDGTRFNLNDFISDGKLISFSLNSRTDVGDKSTTFVDINVNKLDYYNMFKSQLELISEKKAKKVERDFKKKLEDFFLFAVGDDVNFSFSINIPQINFYNQKTGNLYARAVLKNNQFVINSLKASLPGDSYLKLNALLEINKQQMQLKGNSSLILIGKNLDELLLALDEVALESPKKTDNQRFGPFYINIKGFLYGQNIHLREIIGKINDDSFAGQMLIDYSKEFNASSAFNFTNLNFDKYVSNIKSDDYNESDDNTLTGKLDFLRFIDSFFDKLDISLEAENMVKSNETYKDVSLYAQIVPGITEIKNIYFDTDLLGEVNGKAHIDLTDFQPRIDVDLNIDKYDTDLLFYGKQKTQNDTYNFDGKWNEEKISFEKLGSFKGRLNINVDELRFYHFLLKNFAMLSHTDESRFIIDKARADLFGNKIEFYGFMTSDYPSFNLSFSALDLNFFDFMENTFGLKQINSVFNLSASLASTGYSIRQLVQNLKGKLSIVTKGMRIDGFDFASVGKALPLVKRREYIQMVSDELLYKGYTDFSFFTGESLIESGQIGFNNLILSGPNIKSGKVSGVIDLNHWTLDINSDFDVITSENKVFNLTAKTSGKMPNIDVKWDNKGMTRYWEDKFFGGN